MDPVVAVTMDDEFNRVSEEILLALMESNAFLTAYNEQFCSVSYVNLQAFTCAELTGFASFFTEDTGAPPACWIYFEPVVNCTNGSGNFLPETRDFYSAFSGLVNSGGVNCHSCIANARNSFPPTMGFLPILVAVGVGGGTALESTLAVLASRVLTGILIASASAVVGDLAGDVVEGAITILGNERADSLTNETQVVVPQTDIFVRAANCRPEDQQNQTFGGDVCNADFLRGNLDATGCDCPRGGTAAHHSVMKKADVGGRGRAVLSRCGIDIHDAVNGVCLPTTYDMQERTGTSSPVHGQLGVHSDAVQQAIAGALERVAGPPGQQCDVQAVRSRLKTIGDAISRGDISIEWLNGL